jgi:hypothetical protein
MNIRIAEIEEAFKDIFSEEDGVVTSVETVYEKSDDEEYLKLIISLQDFRQKISIIHTKFIFKTDVNKRHIYRKFFYLLI